MPLIPAFRRQRHLDVLLSPTYIVRFCLKERRKRKERKERK